MTTDPYSLCPCGTGTKQKWCQAKAGMQQVDQAIGMIRNNQQDSSLALLEKIRADQSQPECLRAYATTVQAQALDMFERPEEGLKLADEATKTYPDSGIVAETLGDFFFTHQDYANALEVYEDAIAKFPVEAIAHRCRTLLKMGSCHNFQGRPLAAWACWRRAIAIDPNFKQANEAIEEFVHQNGLLPNQARQGLSLKQADEFSLFQEELAERWEHAAKEESTLHLADLVSDFEFLTEREPANAAAWFNLGVALAWSGQNARAIEALANYVDAEKDLSAAADAWDLAEVLRMGAGAEEFSDNLLSVALYAVVDPDNFVKQLQQSKHVVVVSTPDGHRTLHWMDKEVAPQDGAVPILGGPPRQLAQLNMYGPVVEIVATNPEALTEVKTKFDLTVGATVQFDSTTTRAGNPSTLDSEPFLVFDQRQDAPEERQKRTVEAVRKYFEETWLKRPLRSLDGVSPMDAAQNAKLKRRLEGAIRFRERSFTRRDVAYNFDRLRHKLGLPIAGSGLSEHDDPSTPATQVDVSAYSASELSQIDPSKLNDDDLIAAYRSAVGMDSGPIANQFARVVVGRASMADQLDLNAIYRRLIQDAWRAKEFAEASEWIDKARSFDADHNEGKDSATYDLWSARLLLAQDRKDDGIAAVRALFEHHPDRLDVSATAVESLMSSGAFAVARELADLGLARAEERRDGDYQARFREYVREAKARA